MEENGDTGEMGGRRDGKGTDTRQWSGQSIRARKRQKITGGGSPDWQYMWRCIVQIELGKKMMGKN